MRILVLGGGYAGILSALRLAHRGLGAQVLLVNSSPEMVERIRLHELAAGSPPPRRPIAELLRGSGVELVVGKVTALDLEQQFATLADGRVLPFDRLIYALGSVASDGGV